MTLRETMILKHGSEENWKAYMRQIASKGGSKTGIKKGFALMDPEAHKKASSKGGKKKQ